MLNIIINISIKNEKHFKRILFSLIEIACIDTCSIKRRFGTYLIHVLTTGML